MMDIFCQHVFMVSQFHDGHMLTSAEHWGHIGATFQKNMTHGSELTWHISVSVLSCAIGNWHVCQNLVLVLMLRYWTWSLFWHGVDACLVHWFVRHWCYGCPKTWHMGHTVRLFDNSVDACLDTCLLGHWCYGCSKTWHMGHTVCLFDNSVDAWLDKFVSAIDVMAAPKHDTRVRQYVCFIMVLTHFRHLFSCVLVLTFWHN